MQGKRWVAVADAKEHAVASPVPSAWGASPSDSQATSPLRSRLEGLCSGGGGWRLGYGAKTGMPQPELPAGAPTPWDGISSMWS